VTALLVAIAILVRAPLLEVALALGAIHQPIVAGTLVLGVVAASSFLSARDQHVDPSVGRIVSVAGDLRAGRPLRAVVSSGVLGERLASMADSGRPIRAPLDDLEATFGADALLVQATLDIATEGGGPVADTFDRLAADMIESERTRRERRAALAPALAQAVVVGGAPTVVLATMLANGRWLAMLAAGPSSAAIALFGAVSLVAGIVWTTALVGRGRRRWR
jgi:Flp pilus assembly protein TadB